MAAGFKMAEADRVMLESWLRAPSTTQGIAPRARVILASAQGEGVRPRRVTAAKEQAVISVTLRKPKVATHWSARRLAKEVGLSSATVHRIWQK
jgi:hypothetical protein